MKTKHKKYNYPYRKLSFNRNAANAWNDLCYEKWLIADEGQERPDPQRYTNFFFKYGMKNKITDKSILSYIPNEYKELIYRWVRLTTAEKKEVRKYAPDAGRKITHWLHQAEILYLNDIYKKQI